jgi:hypothetical protein
LGSIHRYRAGAIGRCSSDSHCSRGSGRHAVSVQEILGTVDDIFERHLGFYEIFIRTKLSGACLVFCLA